jgi:putative membrane protein
MCFAGSPLYAKTTKQTSTHKTKSAASAMTDQQFADNACEGGMAEVKLGQLAQDKGENQAVKDFGKRMVTDHTKANDDLKAAAQKDNITLPDKMSAHDQAQYDRLSKLSGEAFDRAYARDMVRDHREDIAAFKHEADDGKVTGIKDFASQTLPTLEDHLKDARQMYHAVEPASTAKKSGQ